jgi:hypothetical protein
MAAYPAGRVDGDAVSAGMKMRQRVRLDMTGTAYWVVNGRVDDDPFRNSGLDSPELLMQRAGGVFVASSRNGTTIRWAMFASNWASLYYVGELLPTLPSPYTFEFFLSGWFTQTIEDPYLASGRLQELVVKSDVHLRQKTHVRSLSPEFASWIPDLLIDAFQDKAVNPDFSVDCVFDPISSRFAVQRVGRNSGIAKLFGTQPTTFPCLSGHSYDQIVSRAYKRVVDSGEPHYDHVCASLPVANTQRWLTYQRVILPQHFPDGRSGVTVVSEFGKVDINLL